MTKTTGTGQGMGDRRQQPKGRMQEAKSKPARAHGIRSICVYCGSNVGNNPAYGEAARALGALMAADGIGLVYGGGGLGLMGELARSVLKHGGRVTGIIPAFLSNRERMLRDADELIVVDDMHQRKKLMFDRSDAFVALPGGIGTLEELVEQLTWAQLGRHTKPIVLLNAEGFWAPFLTLLEHMRAEGFIRPEMAVRFLTADKPQDVLPTILANVLPPAEGAAETVQEKF
jgi:uncharacterized protein (TIGR00730 family)